MTENNSKWEEQLRGELGTAPVPDFSAWCEKHPDAIRSLQHNSAVRSQKSTDASILRRRMMTIMKCTAAALLIAGTFAWLNVGDNTSYSALFAEEIPGVDHVEEMSWTLTFYSRHTTEDGKESWIETQRQLCSYRHPNQYRETQMNSVGEILSVHITDYSANRTLELGMKSKKAVLKTAEPQRNERGPFAWVGDELRERKVSGNTHVKSVSLQGETMVDDSKVNIVRVVTQDVELDKTSQHELYFDQNTKQLAGIWGPIDPSLTREKLEGEVQNSGKAWHRFQPVALLTHEIDLSPKLQDSEFSLDAPKGFELETVVRPTVTEEEMLEFLKAAARFNQGEFPDSPVATYDRDKLNQEWKKAETDRTGEANELISLINKIRRREIYQTPLQRFVSDNTLSDSFQYVGAGVKLGEANRIVCWYQPQSGKTWRAVYGNLTVRNVDKNDLPFLVEK